MCLHYIVKSMTDVLFRFVDEFISIYKPTKQEISTVENIRKGPI